MVAGNNTRERHLSLGSRARLLCYAPLWKTARERYTRTRARGSKRLDQNMDRVDNPGVSATTDLKFGCTSLRHAVFFPSFLGQNWRSTSDFILSNEHFC